MSVKNNEQTGTASALRREEKTQELWDHSDGSETSRGASQRTGSERVEPHRENRTTGNRRNTLSGGILDQLIEDASKQLAKARECVVWYQSEIEEYKQKLQRLEELKALEEEELDNTDLKQ